MSVPVGLVKLFNRMSKTSRINIASIISLIGGSLTVFGSWEDLEFPWIITGFLLMLLSIEIFISIHGKLDALLFFQRVFRVMLAGVVVIGFLSFVVNLLRIMDGRI